MGQLLDRFPLVGIATVALGALGLLVWLAGLAIVLRGSRPGERAEILRAYGASLPLIARAKGQNDNDTESATTMSGDEPKGRRDEASPSADQPSRLDSG
jgi:hypothetical protein